MNEASTPSTPAQPPLRRPANLTELFLAFTSLALQGFGGVLAIAQRELVERRHWLDRDDFVELLSVSQVLPGPNIVNLSLMLGDRFFGLRGAIVAVAGMLLAPLVIVLGLTLVYTAYAHHPLVSGALRGMGAVAAGLVMATAIKLSGTLKKNAMGLPICLGLAALTFAVIAGLRWPLAWVIVGIGAMAIAIAWRRLAP